MPRRSRSIETLSRVCPCVGILTTINHRPNSLISISPENIIFLTLISMEVEMFMFWLIQREQHLINKKLINFHESSTRHWWKSEGGIHLTASCAAVIEYPLAGGEKCAHAFFYTNNNWIGWKRWRKEKCMEYMHVTGWLDTRNGKPQMVGHV